MDEGEALAWVGMELFADLRQRALGEVGGEQGQQRVAQEREVGQKVGGGASVSGLRLGWRRAASGCGFPLRPNGRG